MSSSATVWFTDVFLIVLDNNGALQHKGIRYVRHWQTVLVCRIGSFNNKKKHEHHQLYSLMILYQMFCQTGNLFTPFFCESYVADEISRKGNRLAACLIHFALAWVDSLIISAGNSGLSRYICPDIFTPPVLLTCHGGRY